MPSIASAASAMRWPARGVAVDERFVAKATMTDEVGYRFAERFLAEKPRPTALLVSSMMMALGAFRAMRAAGLELGRDISMIAHDDVFPFLNADRMLPTMSTTRSSIRAAGTRVGRTGDRAPRRPRRPRPSTNCGRSTSSSAARPARRRRAKLGVIRSRGASQDAFLFAAFSRLSFARAALAEDNGSTGPDDPIDQALDECLASRKERRRPGMIECLGTAYELWDKALNAVYGRT